MKALISPFEPRFDGFRIAEVREQAFEVAPPLYWVDVEVGISQDTHYFVPDVGPVPYPVEDNADETQ